jgi:hypothetical protein
LPQEVFNIITDSKPQGITIEKYQMDLDKGFIELTGVSSDRDSLLSFRENIQKKEK